MSACRVGRDRGAYVCLGKVIDGLDPLELEPERADRVGCRRWRSATRLSLRLSKNGGRAERAALTQTGDVSSSVIKKPQSSHDVLVCVK
jgi:hypothetical protein